VVRTGRLTGRTTVVLGSTQDRAVIDDERAAEAVVDVVRRSTGGGAVVVAPDAQVWIDLWVPRRHRLWDDDIVRASSWLGDAWARALESLGAGPMEVHRGPAVRSVWSDLVCFAGLGPGELHVSGRKVTGLAQRRTRPGARFHTLAPLVWRPGPLLDVVRTDERQSAVTLLEDAAVGLRDLVTTWPTDVDDVDVIATVENAVIAALP
jgi:lipoate-protein ligase A